MSLFEGRVHLLQFVFLKDSENTCSWFFFFVWTGKGAHQDDYTVVELMEFLHGGNFVSKIVKIWKVVL